MKNWRKKSTGAVFCADFCVSAFCFLLPRAPPRAQLAPNSFVQYSYLQNRKKRAIRNSTIRPHAEALNALQQSHRGEEGNQEFLPEFAVPAPATRVVPTSARRDIATQTHVMIWARGTSLKKEQLLKQNLKNSMMPLMMKTWHQCKEQLLKETVVQQERGKSWTG